MNSIGNALAAPLKAVGLIAKPPAIPAPLPVAQRDAAAIAAQTDDELAKRRGGAADIITGVGGAEPTAATGKATLGS